MSLRPVCRRRLNRGSGSLSVLGPRRVRSLDGIAEDGLPAAVVVETVQGEGGVKPARPAWLRALASWTREHGTLLVVDDIQRAVGAPDRSSPSNPPESSPTSSACPSPSAGTGCPWPSRLIRPEYDVWKPGEHNGTFRGYNPAFVTATRALELFWSDGALEERTMALGERVGRGLRHDRDRRTNPAVAGRTDQCIHSKEGTSWETTRRAATCTRQLSTRYVPQAAATAARRSS
ncbi:aminotransferase class III-fold pyridoxal phosphate-dependent enzyme [Streptomyces sp. NPDC017454]|uniref:aminotransferase class III-fold pyridoxal phosphate-dependent enzyme n=1 Tax=Streptomyces sp. NPDC017454 TaxID=3364997 RepID=UPI00378F7CD9